MRKTRDSSEKRIDPRNRHVCRFVPAVLISVALSLTASPVHSHHGPKWIELSTAALVIIAADNDNDHILNWREEMIGTDADSADSDGLSRRGNRLIAKELADEIVEHLWGNGPHVEKKNHQPPEKLPNMSL